MTRRGPHYAENFTDSLDQRTVMRGSRYAEEGRVRVLRSEPDRLVAEVRGSARRPYDVVVRFSANGVVRGTCTCPVGEDCKHAVAAILADLGGAAPSPPPGQRQPPAITPRSPEDWAQYFARADEQAWLARIELATRATKISAQAVPELHYLVDPQAPGRFPLRAFAAARLKSGRLGAQRDVTFASLAMTYAAYAKEDDLRIGALAAALERRNGEARARPDLAEALLDALIATERFHYLDAAGPALRLGATRTAELRWTITPSELQRLVLHVDGSDVQTFAEPLPWYVDPEKSEAGLLALEVDAALVAPLLSAPSLDTAAVERVAKRFAAIPELARVPSGAAEIRFRHIAEPPGVELALRSFELDRTQHVQRYGDAPYDTLRFIDVAEIAFRYGPHRVTAAASEVELRHTDHGEVTIRRRDEAAEQAALSELVRAGLYRTSAVGLPYPRDAALYSATDYDDCWARIVHRDLPRFRALGWTIAVDPEFRHRLAIVDDAPEDLVVRETEGGWFDCELGVAVAGERVSLLPLLLELFRAKRRVLDDLLASDDPDAFAYVPHGTRRLAIPAARLRRIVEQFTEYLDPERDDDDVALSAPRAATLLAGLDERTRLAEAPERLRALAARFADFAGIESVAPPEGLRAELRPYQLSGLAWLQFLRAHGLGGILADDMGLGKTVQTLAHLLVERDAGRLDRPALLVVPTSLVPNWRDEAARFAPSLRVLTLHGPDRATRFASIADHDLVVTTYPLVPRDAALHEHEWSFVILDEAQTVKNARTKAARVVRALRTDHRLALTGTPIENHLGELWAQCDFLMPGMLGSQRAFTRRFRTPIEKRGDVLRRDSLARRVRPFVLRRTKGEVARELPEKTEIVRRVELGDEQRDLYESLRVAMHDRIRREVQKRGLARSKIVVLDAILKLRQACCDPRLVKLPRARACGRGAKLELMREMLPELIEDGRRILIFSQFTSFLDLLETELAELAIPYVQLRGTTKDRAAPVARFCAGEVPIFLISLRAGGTGLNLIEADCVIHLDPWWNPAVERQATDRAHRIGQRNPVFVYKLIVAGSIEERILALQERKAAVAENLFAEGDAPFDLDANDLEALFAPIR